MDIYVGNISYQLNEADLQTIFEEFGEVTSVKIITDKDTGKSKGFGFIGMTDDADAQKAIEGLNGREIGGRNLVVNEARQREQSDAPRKSFGGQGGGGNRFRSNDRSSGGGYQNRGGGGGSGRGDRDRDRDRDRGDRNDRYSGNRW